MILGRKNLFTVTSFCGASCGALKRCPKARMHCSCSRERKVGTWARSNTATFLMGVEPCLMLPQVAGMPNMRLM
eukprot:2431714-Alexandrium_andersonii.AAC.1